MNDMITNFNCIFCLNIVINPIQRNKCDQLYCRNCIEKYKDNNNKCPNCNKVFVPHENLIRILKNLLNLIKFDCLLKCGNTFTYEKKESHINEFLFINCLYCEEKIEFSKHYEICNKRPIYCNEANIYFQKNLKEIYEEHSKKIIVSYAQLFKDLQKLI